MGQHGHDRAIATKEADFKAATERRQMSGTKTKIDSGKLSGTIFERGANRSKKAEPGGEESCQRMSRKGTFEQPTSTNTLEDEGRR